MTFVGLSQWIDNAKPVAPSVIPNLRFGVTSKTNDESPITLTAGDQFIVGFYYDSWDREYDGIEDADVEVFCTFEVASGSASVRLSCGYDPDWDMENPALATTPLGTHTISAGITAIPAFPDFDVDDFLAYGDEPIVFVEVLSGSIAVSEIRFRIWPVGGALGGYVEHGPLTTQGGAGLVDGTLAGNNVQGEGYFAGDAGAAYADAAAAYLGEGAGSIGTIDGRHTGTQSQTIWRTDDVGVAMHDLEFQRANWSANTKPALNQFAVTVSGFIWELTDLVANGDIEGAHRPPDQIGDYYEQYVIPQGSPAVTGLVLIGRWASWTYVYDDTGTVSESIEAAGGRIGVSVVSNDVVGSTPIPTPVGSIPFPANTPPTSDTIFHTPATHAEVTVPLTITDDNSVIVVSVEPDYTPYPYTGASWYGIFMGYTRRGRALYVWSGNDGGQLVNVDLPPFQYWSEFGAPPPPVDIPVPLRIRQRGDGLAMGAPRVRASGSAYYSERVRGIP